MLTVTAGRDLLQVPAELSAFRTELKDARHLVIRYQPSRTNVGAILDGIRAAGVEVVDLVTEEADLEDVFLRLTHSARPKMRADAYAMSDGDLGSEIPTVAARTGQTSGAPSGHKSKNQYAAFRHRDFRLFVAMRTLSNMAQLIQSVAVGWQVYDITRRPLDLGLVGLVLFLPQILFALPAGQAADRFQRRRLVMAMLGLNAIASTALLVLTASGSQRVDIILAILFLFGVGRAFVGPATIAILPSVVPRDELPNAITWNSSTWQAAVVMAARRWAACSTVSGRPSSTARWWRCCCRRSCAAALLRPARQSAPTGARGLRELLAGVRFVRDHPLLLGAISLDLFAVLFGGATALLAGLRPRHSVGRSGRPRPAAQRAGHWFGGSCAMAGRTPAASPRRAQHVHLRRRLRPGDHRLRPVDQFLSLDGRAGRRPAPATWSASMYARP